jgi:FkbM family methyltransferase
MKYAGFYAGWQRFWYLKAPVPFEIRRLMCGLLPYPGDQIVEIEGVKFRLNLHDLLQINLYNNHMWDPESTWWWLYLASKASQVMDIGAHVGYFSLLAARSAGQESRVYSVEPNPAAREQLEHNIMLNEFSNLEVLPFAISDSKASIEMYIRTFLEPGASSRYWTPGYDRQITVSTTTLDELCDRLELHTMHLIKIDIEGGELALVEGSLKGLGAGRYPVLMIELHPAILSETENRTLLNLLRDCRYTIYSLTGRTIHRIDGSPGDCSIVLAFHPRASEFLPFSLEAESLSLPVTES